MEWKTSSEPVPYEEAVAFMEARAQAIYEGMAEELVWLLEHPPLYTAGTSADARDLIDARFPVYATGRGGQYTYHGPGQRIAYVLLDLNKRGKDLRAYVQNLEKWLIDTLAAFGVTGEIRDGRVGVWVKTGLSEAKIAALGVRVRKWVSYHGVALNVAPDLTHYAGIIPCGVTKFGITSLAALGKAVSMQQVDAQLRESFGKVFIS